MYKIVGFLKKRPGMTTAEFREYYETYHRVIGEKVLAGYAAQYMRRFLEPYGPTAEADEQPFDVIMEIWYPDRATYEASQAHLSTPEIAAEIAEDEEKLFDRPENRFYHVQEVVSDLPTP